MKEKLSVPVEVEREMETRNPSEGEEQTVGGIDKVIHSNTKGPEQVREQSRLAGSTSRLQ